ncbi:uncharacterized protein [Phaseolus vulgaris]|uniref:uncharacterized protein n=1 Tax=Phaseolus vulgaris TaxID=3885 RepID=UPI0035C9D185
MVLSWLVNSVSLPIRQSVIWMDIVVDVWNDLKTRYSQGDLSRISDLQLEASSLNQNDLLGHAENVFYRKVGFPNQENKNFKFNNNKKICTHCGRNGHTIDTCYRKHGFPPGYNPPNSRTAPSLNVVLTDDIPFKNCQQEQDSGDMRSAFTAQQYQVLSALIKQNATNNIATQPPVQVNQVGSLTVDTNHKDSTTDNVTISNLYTSSKGSWILDSGATDHVCTCLSDFTSYKSIKHVLISLPMDIVSILVVLELWLSDNLTKEKIGIVEAKDGLYIFHASVFQRHTTNRSVHSFHSVLKDTNVWHNRLGHLSDERLHVLRYRYSFISAHKPYMCDTCHRAKQRKLLFALSDSITSKFF